MSKPDIKWVAKIYIEGCESTTFYQVQPDEEFPESVIALTYNEDERIRQRMTFDDDSAAAIVHAITEIRRMRKTEE